MRNTGSIRFLVGAGLGVGIADPFTPVRWCAARQHPRRDNNGHSATPQANSGTTPPPGGTTPPPAGTTPPAGGTPPAGTTPAGGKPPTTDPAAQDDWSELFKGLTPAQVKDSLENSRKWETRSKDNFDKATKFDELVKAITGTNGDGEGDQDPDKLASDLSAAQRETRETKVENAVLRHAGANGAALVDSRSFMTSVKNLDPSADDFTTQIEAAIQKAVESNPAFASAPPPPGDPFLRHPSSLRTSGREQGSAEADRRFGAPKT